MENDLRYKRMQKIMECNHLNCFFFFFSFFFFLHQSKSSFLEQKGSVSTCILYLLEIVKPPSKMKNTREELNDEWVVTIYNYVLTWLIVYRNIPVKPNNCYWKENIISNQLEPNVNDLLAVQEENMGKEFERTLQFHHERTFTTAPAHCTWIFSHLHTTQEGSHSCITSMT